VNVSSSFCHSMMYSIYVNVLMLLLWCKAVYNASITSFSPKDLVHSIKLFPTITPSSLDSHVTNDVKNCGDCNTNYFWWKSIVARSIASNTSPPPPAETTEQETQHMSEDVQWKLATLSSLTIGGKESLLETIKSIVGASIEVNITASVLANDFAVKSFAAVVVMHYYDVTTYIAVNSSFSTNTTHDLMNILKQSLKSGEFMKTFRKFCNQLNATEFTYLLTNESHGWNFTESKRIAGLGLPMINIQEIYSNDSMTANTNESNSSNGGDASKQLSSTTILAIAIAIPFGLLFILLSSFTILLYIRHHRKQLRAILPSFSSIITLEGGRSFNDVELGTIATQDPNQL